MTTPLRIWLVALLLGSGVFSCIDHQFNPLSPLRTRLKTTNNINFGGFPFSTEYNYDASNRVTSFTTSIGTKGVYQYDEQSRYKQFDYFPKLTDDKNAERTYFTYDSNGNDFRTGRGYVENGNYTGTRESFSYRLDIDKRVLGFNGFPQGVYTGESYFYTGDNITKVDYVAGRVTENFNYEYDDKPNPYYGLIAPDIGATRRFSRNNVTKIIRDRDGVVTAEYVYEYNAQGLPIKQKEKNGPGVVEYTYESY